MSAHSPSSSALATDGHSVRPSAAVTQNANGRQPVQVTDLIKIPSLASTGAQYSGGTLPPGTLFPEPPSAFGSNFLQPEAPAFGEPLQGSLAAAQSESRPQVDTHFLERLQSSTPINGQGSSLAPVSNPFFAPSPFPAVNHPAPAPPQLDGAPVAPRPSPLPALPEKASGEGRSRMPAQKKAIEKKRRHSEQKKKHAERARKAAATRRANKRKLEEQRQVLPPIPEALPTPTRSPVEVMPGDNTPRPADPTLKEKDRVLCREKEGLPFDELAEIVKKVGDKLYVHPVDTDRRMDHWVLLKNVMRAPRRRASRIDVEVASRETRASKRRHQESNPVSEREEGNDAVALAEMQREQATAVKNVGNLVFGGYELDAWYFSPFNGSDKHIPCVYMCPYCLKYFSDLRKHFNHEAKCKWDQPPGAVVYEDGDLKVYEVDGIAHVGYCQRLAILGKLFLDHKTLFFDVGPFLFYVMTVGGELAGFFSKEKPERKSVYNLACLLTLPQHQKKGLGRFLIELSYELSRREGRQGQPEKPLSDLGQVSYRSFWKFEVLKAAKAASDAGEEEISSERLAEQTGISIDRVNETLVQCDLQKIWKGEHSANLRNQDLIKKQLDAMKPPVRKLKSICLLKPFCAPRPPSTPRVPMTKGAASSKRKVQRTPKRASKGNGKSPGPSPLGLRLGVSQARSPGISKPVGSPHGYTPQRRRTPPNGIMRRRTPQGSEIRSNQLDPALQQFCEHNTPEKVMAPIDSDAGLPRSTYSAFAKNLGLGLQEVYSAVRKRAQEIMMQRHRRSSSAQTAATGRPRGCGAKDVGHIKRVMDGNRQSSQERPTGGAIRGKMVSGFMKAEADASSDEEKQEPVAVRLPPNGRPAAGGSSNDVINLCSDPEEEMA